MVSVCVLSVCLLPLPKTYSFVGWFVSRITQKTTEQIYNKLRQRMGPGPEQTPLTFPADPEKVADPGKSTFSGFSQPSTMSDGFYHSNMQR